MMSHKAMKDRHWQRIAYVTKHPLDVQNTETFTLRNLMDAPLLKNKEDIEVSVSFTFEVWKVFGSCLLELIERYYC